MTVLHILFDGPTDLSTRFIDQHSLDHEVAVIDMTSDGNSYDSLLEEILRVDKVISW